MNDINILIDYVENNLLPNIDMKSVRHFDPIVVNNVPESWKLLGVGNYAAVLVHIDFPQYAIKIYAEGRCGIEEEIKAYNKINDHPSFSRCFYSSEKYLILKRLEGKTLYNCINEGIHIPESVIKDIDEALEYSKSLGLNPNDVHAKNVMIVKGRGIVADISDFTKIKKCSLWEDFKKAYYKIYIPLLQKKHPPIPEFYLNMVRRSYRLFRILFKK
ncbi:serine/threonine protein kinase [Clostridium chromiireducens]|uniref:Serine/threonine protein kinase n=1 Tax=Clostridium chromiireducens TaxID=225345 RepID=A0A964W581_9CLOT|nr:serine/threonine protein kinase [Clostridium chromiireducens]MVX67075.1 serine/threonine protein kinase [Clostridium chromiireducens]